MALVYINVRLNAWNRDFYNALAAKNWHGFIHSHDRVFLPRVRVYRDVTARIWFRQLLEIRWRTWLTTRFRRTRWLNDIAFYRIERDRLADNPDQRISDDLESLATTTLALSLDLLSTVVTLFSFIVILWNIAGALTFHRFRAAASTIPRLHGVGRGALRAARLGRDPEFGKPLVADQLSEAACRGELPLSSSCACVKTPSRSRSTGARTPNADERGRDLPVDLRQLARIMTYTKRLTIVTCDLRPDLEHLSVYRRVAPYFSGAYPIGTLFQIADAFGTVSESFSWFINSFTTLAGWRATVNRLREFVRSIDEQHRARRFLRRPSMAVSIVM